MELIDDIYMDMRILEPIPPFQFEGISDSIHQSNLKNYDQILKDYKLRESAIGIDTSRTVLVIHDSIKLPHKPNLKYLKNHFCSYQIKTDSLIQSSVYKIDLNKFKSAKFNFMSSASFPQNSEIWNIEHPFHIGAAISFTTITFDTNRKFGVLEGGIVYGRLNGHGFRIYIKKENNDWIIDFIEETWIS
ncbi:hypothetical protein [Urechidicola vernalis]|uniref:Uncharacterized protein n=1 Tax=Urechidicola vernalis TaxID=3075600 RepID=A0ABU2Y2M5_9FLAO|nr:hypothetical protein [Urechidicola sp. P050]MDT0552410.1 hypothetical protein [Urechidicola sp. P050]